MGRRARIRLLAGLLLGLPLRAHAIDLEKLVMPGPVIGPHADVEAECGRCHAPFASGAQRALCIDCHEEIGKDQAAKRGFHGRAPGASTAECRTCHTEHEGREADVTGLVAETFDHDATDFALSGAHRGVPCRGCHPPDAAYRDAPSACVACHRDDDPHAGRLGEQCGDCHRVSAWTDTAFEHDETGFPLSGRHREVECALCHPNQRYEDTATDCHGCHRLDDAHLGRFGTRCESCHSPRAWRPATFDHARETDFALEGRHGEVACEACHKKGLPGPELPSDCVSCHRADDEHRGRFGAKCEQCHSPRGWSSAKFDHDRETDFPLRGAHRSARCEACHTGGLHEQELETSCYACHREDDVHHGQLGTSCERCHQEEGGWQKRIAFDHDLTRFPLLGLHAVAACEQCHVTPRFMDAEIDCVACHADDDAHGRRLGPDCALCHNPNGWLLWRFDHEARTGFALHGAHAELDCHACHRVPVEEEIRLSRSCYACHAKDDRHFGSYGRDCARCHTEDAWREVRLIR